MGLNRPNRTNSWAEGGHFPTQIAIAAPRVVANQLRKRPLAVIEPRAGKGSDVDCFNADLGNGDATHTRRPIHFIGDKLARNQIQSYNGETLNLRNVDAQAAGLAVGARVQAELTSSADAPVPRRFSAAADVSYTAKSARDATILHPKTAE